MDQNVTVNTFPGLVHTARHTMGSLLGNHLLIVGDLEIPKTLGIGEKKDISSRFKKKNPPTKMVTSKMTANNLPMIKFYSK